MGNNPSVETILDPTGSFRAIRNSIEEENRRKEQERLAREEQERQLRQRIIEEAERQNRIVREGIILRTNTSNSMVRLINIIRGYENRVNNLGDGSITNGYNGLINAMEEFRNSIDTTHRDNTILLTNEPSRYETIMNNLIRDINNAGIGFRNNAKNTVQELKGILNGYDIKLGVIDRPLLKSKSDEIKNSLISFENQIDNSDINRIRNQINYFNSKIRANSLYNEIETAYNNLISARRIANNNINGYEIIINNNFRNYVISNGVLLNKYDYLSAEIVSFNLIKDTNKNPDYLISQSQKLKGDIKELIIKYVDDIINPKLNSENSYINSLNRNDELRNNYDEINSLIMRIKNTYDSYSSYQLIQNDIILINSRLNLLLVNVVRRKRLDEINKQRIKIEDTLRKLRAIEGLKNSLNFGIFNDIYRNIDNSINNFKNSLDSGYTDVYGLESIRLGIETNISNLKTGLNELKTARERIVEINNYKIILESDDVINKKRLLNDGEINNLYIGVLEKLNDFSRNLNTYTAVEINNRIDNDIKNVYNNFDTQLNIRFKRMEARNSLNEKIEFLNQKRELLNVDFYVPEKLPELVKLKEDMENYIDDLINQISISDIRDKVDFFSLKAVNLIDEIEREKRRRMNLIGNLQVSYEYKAEVKEQIIYKSKLMYYEWISIYNYNSARGIIEENVISRDGIYGNHYKKTIGEIIVRYSSKVSNDNSPSYLFDKDLKKSSSFGSGEGNLYNQAGDYVGNSRVMIDGDYINGEFISLKYSQRFKLLRYAFKLGDNYGKGVGKWEIYYKDENDIYKELDRNDNRLTLEDYKNTYDGEDVYNKFLVSNNISASEYLIIFTGMVGSNEVGNRGIELKQIYLWTGVESNVKATNENNISPPRT